MHAAKGLEFEYVFVVGLEEGLFPHSRSYADPTEMEEERRLAYVAITRAKKHLYLTHAKSRSLFGTVNQNPTSRFIEDIDSDILDYSSYDTEIDHALEQKGFHRVSSEEEYEDMDYDMPQLKKGMQVRHQIFGKGKVVDCNESTAKIDFGSRVGIKELVLEYAHLEPI
jgi:DNA helicase II / ATP-dependent DNA helicase PcrA